jgi:hypothetical protein
MAKDKLKCLGCGGTLRKNSPGRYVELCGNCFRDRQNGAEAPSGPAPKPAKKRTPVETGEQAQAPAPRTHAVALTESQIDRLFLGSTFEAKCFAVQRILEQEHA